MNPGLRIILKFVSFIIFVIGVLSLTLNLITGLTEDWFMTLVNPLSMISISIVFYIVLDFVGKEQKNEFAKDFLLLIETSIWLSLILVLLKVVFNGMKLGSIGLIVFVSLIVLLFILSFFKYFKKKFIHV